MAARPPAPASSGAPNQSLYVKNLNDKIHKDDLRRGLYMLFSTYGPVLDVVTVKRGSKGQHMRGQAHVCFRDVQTATQAMRALQGFELFDKEMSIQYARGESHIIPKLRGTFEAPNAAKKEEELTALQKSIFDAPPSSMPGKPTTNGVDEVPHSLKRPRDEVEEDEDVAMDEDEDEDDAPMDEDDDD